MHHKLLLIVLLVLCGSQAKSQEGNAWKLKKNKNGIQVFTRPVEGIKYHEYRVETRMSGTIERFYSLFKDFEAYRNLFQDVREFKIHRNLPDRHISYLRTNTPFPAKDRDAVMDNIFSYDEDLQKLRIEISCIQDYYEPSKKVIQISDCHGFWEVRQVGENTIDVVHQFIADPGGSIPAFIVNIKTVQNPLKTMESVKTMITSSKYDDTSKFLSFKKIAQHE